MKSKREELDRQERISAMREQNLENHGWEKGSTGWRDPMSGVMFPSHTAFEIQTQRDNRSKGDLTANAVVRVIAQKGKLINAGKIYGWGDDAMEFSVGGQRVFEISVWNGKDPKFSIYINEEGELVLTSYAGRYTMTLDGNARLEPTRPWKNK